MSESRQKDVKNPHFQVPFRFGGINGGAFMNDQDTFDDIRDCIKTIIAYPIGSRQELPTFGSPDVTFQVDTGRIPVKLKSAIALWEPRPATALTGQQGITDEMLVGILTKTGITHA